MSEQDRPYTVQVEATASGQWLGTVVGPDAPFGVIVWGDSRDECIANARARVDWLKNRPPAETFEL